MRVNIITIAFASGLLLSTAAFADETVTTPAPAATSSAAPTTAAAPAAPAAHNPDDDVYCRTMASTGSYITARVCKTQREWKQITANSQATLNNLQNSNAVGSGMPR